MVLVLSRRRDEKILIGDAITIVVLETGHNKVKLGIDAPLHINVIRSELQDRRVDTPPQPSEDLT